MLRARGMYLPIAATVLCILAASAQAFAQQNTYTITGRVRDADGGAPLVSVQVVVSGTRYGSLTNETGTYSIVAQLSPGPYTVEAQSIGRATGRQAITAGAERIINVPDIAMTATALALEEIVVTGTAAPTARRALGNAVSTVSAAQLTETPATTIDQALQGKVAGATITSNTGTPGGGVSVRLRGTSSIVGGAEPLYIVDGVIIDNNADQQVDLGYRSNASNRLADLDPNDIERIEILKGAAAAALYGSRANNGVVQIFTKRGRAGVNRVTFGSRMTHGDLEHRMTFALTPKDASGNPVVRYDPQQWVFREPWSSDSYVSLSGGSTDTQYYLSGNFVNENGIMYGSDHEKLNVRMNLDQRMASWLNLSAGANYIRAKSDLVINGENGTGGLLTAILFTPTTFNLAARDTATGQYINKSTFVFPNPLVVLDSWKIPQTVNRFVGSFGLNANPWSTLRLTYRLGYDQYAMETDQFIPRGDYANTLGSARSLNRRNMLLNNDAAANYDFAVGGNLRMTSSIGLNHTYQKLDQLNATATDLTPETELVRGAVQTASQAQTELITLGYFGQQQLAYRDRLFLTAAVRRDASSTFGKDQRWQTYPKFSGSWVASEESFVKSSLPWISELRLRAALGWAGNQPPLAQAYARTTRFTGITNITRLGLVPNTSPGNPNLKPERQREWEAGVDLAVWKNRIGTRFTYYNQYVKDLLLVRPLLPSSGYTDVLDNVGELSNKGVELELSTVNYKHGDLSWTSRVIYSRNQNRIEKLFVKPFVVGYTNLVIQGQPVGVHYMPAYWRNPDGTLKRDTAGLPLVNTDTAGRPIATSANRIVGNPWPSWTGSFFNEFRVGKNWTFSFLLDGSFGAKLWNQSQRIMDGFQAGARYDKVLRGEMKLAEMNRLRSIWESYLEDASFVKLRDLTLRYSTSASWLRNVGARGMEIELIGRNLKTWTDYSGYDPEINMFGLSTVERGTDFAVYPNPRTIGLGVRLNY